MAGNDDSDSDEWGTEELVIPPRGQQTERIGVGGGGGDGWAVRITADQKEEEQESGKRGPSPPSPSPSPSPGEPMIIVDVTQLDPNIHSKFDRASVSDSAGASALRKQIERDYSKYASDSDLLADGTVIPCGSSVWRDALVQLRDDRPGHYFVPIFPPSSIAKG